jgi:LmbE family N-acetylglucosaminyl deacetylase
MILRTLNAFKYGVTKRGKYRFAIRNLLALDDIDLVAQVISTETFRRILHATPLPVGAIKSALVLAPHQDDELMGGGGLCIRLRKEAIDCTIAFLTDGAERGLVRKGTALSAAEVVRIRGEEAREVCRQLGARYEELGISNLEMNMGLEHVDRLSALIQRLKPSVVLSPWLLDSAPKHRIANHLLWLACKRHSLPDFEVWGYQVNNGLFANGVLDITEHIDEKIELLRLYKSQNEMIRRYDHQAWGLSAWNARYLPSKAGEPRDRYAEIFCMLPRAEFLSLVERFYARDISRTYLGNTEISNAMGKLHRKLASFGD